MPLDVHIRLADKLPPDVFPLIGEYAVIDPYKVVPDGIGRVWFNRVYDPHGFRVLDKVDLGCGLTAYTLCSEGIVVCEALDVPASLEDRPAVSGMRRILVEIFDEPIADAILVMAGCKDVCIRPGAEIYGRDGLDSRVQRYFTEREGLTFSPDLTTVNHADWKSYFEEHASWIRDVDDISDEQRAERLDYLAQAKSHFEASYGVTL